VDRPDVAAKRKAFLGWIKRIDPRRLVFIDESGANLAMGWSRALPQCNWCVARLDTESV